MSNLLITQIQYIFITIDIICNSLNDYIDDKIITKLYIFVIQDLCLVLSLITLLLFYFNIEAIKRGTLRLIFYRFWSAIVLSLLYISLTISLQILNLRLHWKEYTKGLAVNGNLWKSQTAIVSIFLMQRIVSSFYYFSFLFTLRKLQSNRLIDKLIEKN